MTESINNSRLETFCDGIFAIAITLLILDIKIPETAAIHSTEDLGQQLLLQWPSWFSFLLTFLTLLIAWVNHHHLLAQLHKTSNVFIYANGFLMLTVVVFPYSASLLGQFMNTGYSTYPIVLYCFTIFVHNIGWVAVSSTALKPLDLSKNAVAAKNLISLRNLIIYSCAFNLAVTFIAFWFPITALVMVTLAWIFYLYAGITATAIQ